MTEDPQHLATLQASALTSARRSQEYFCFARALVDGQVAIEMGLVVFCSDQFGIEQQVALARCFVQKQVL